LAQPELMLDN